MLPSEVGQKAGQHPHGLGAALSELVIILPCVWSEGFAREAAHRTRSIHPIETARMAWRLVKRCGLVAKSCRS